MEVLVHKVLLDDEVVDDEVLAAGGVLTHIEIEELMDAVGALEGDGIETDARADELLELARANLAETFESGNLAGRAEFGSGLIPFLLAVAIDGLLLVADTEEGGLEHEEVPVLDDLREILEEEGDHQEADVHTVDIGIGGDDDLIVAEAVYAVLDVERALEEEELLILVDSVSTEAKGIERFASEAEYGLRLGIASGGEGARCGVALGDEDGALLATVVVGIGKVDGAVAEFAVVQVGLLGLLAGLLLDAAYGLAFLLAIDNLLIDNLGRIEISAEIVIEVLGEEIADIGTD